MSYFDMAFCYQSVKQLVGGPSGPDSVLREISGVDVGLVTFRIQLQFGRLVNRTGAIAATGQTAPTTRSNSPSLAPRRNATISACVYSSTGPVGKRELRTAISPLGRQATSTQLPLGLLCLLLSQLMSSSPVAGIPLYGSSMTYLP